MVQFNLLINAHNFDRMDVDDPWMKRLNVFLENRLTQSNADLKQLARLMNVSERHFHRKVKGITQLTPNQYFTLFRLSKAKELLESGSCLTVQQVGKAIGFTNMHYFSQLYAKTYGETPMEVLKRLGWR